MKRTLQTLGTSLACAMVAFGGLVYSFPIEQTGCLGPSYRAACVGSGVYIGDGFILTNQHIAMHLSDRSSFWVPGWKYIWRTIDVAIEKVVFLERDMELGIVKLKPSMLDFVRVVTPCLSTRPVKEGETLMVTSSVYGKFPPVAAELIVSDARPLMRMDPFPRKEAPYSATTIIATLSANQATLVGPGSSGGPVLNAAGELVGLVWTGRELDDGSTEVWISPTSTWLRRLQATDIHEDALRVILGARCM